MSRSRIFFNQKFFVQSFDPSNSLCTIRKRTQDDDRNVELNNQYPFNFNVLLCDFDLTKFLILKLDLIKRDFKDLFEEHVKILHILWHCSKELKLNGTLLADQVKEFLSKDPQLKHYIKLFTSNYVNIYETRLEINFSLLLCIRYFSQQQHTLSSSSSLSNKNRFVYLFFSK